MCPFLWSTLKDLPMFFNKLTLLHPGLLQPDPERPAQRDPQAGPAQAHTHPLGLQLRTPAGPLAGASCYMGAHTHLPTSPGAICRQAGTSSWQDEGRLHRALSSQSLHNPANTGWGQPSWWSLTSNPLSAMYRVHGKANQHNTNDTKQVHKDL